MKRLFYKAVTLGVLVMALGGAKQAQAVTGAQANNIAYWESVNICPRHSGGVCLKRRSNVLNGLGGGAWSASAEGWERGWWEPWMDYVHARWYTYEYFRISPAGNIYARRISG